MKLQATAIPICPMCEEEPVMVSECPTPIFGVNIKWLGRFEVWWWKDRPQKYCQECYLQRDRDQRDVGCDAAYDAGFERGRESALREF